MLFDRTFEADGWIKYWWDGGFRALFNEASWQGGGFSTLFVRMAWQDSGFSASFGGAGWRGDGLGRFLACGPRAFPPLMSRSFQHRGFAGGFGCLARFFACGPRDFPT